MINRRQKLTRAIRATVGAMLLLFNGLAAPVSLAASEPEFCSMECCVAEGHCCCAARKPWVMGQKTDGVPKIAPSQISSKCQYSCASSSKPSHSLRMIARPVARDQAFAKKIPASHGASTPIHNSACFALDSPRAPPTFN
jgi:hypothetical protein